MDSGSDATRGSALARSIALIEALLDARDPASLNHLGSAVGMPKASVHRTMAQLETLGLVQRHPATKLYTVGPALSRLGLGVMLARAQLPDVRLHMQKLVNEIGETVNLAVLDGAEVVYIERVESSEPLRVVLRAGSRVPIHTSSTGKLLLAHLPSRRRRALLEQLDLRRHTEFTITDRAELETQISAIRRQGYSTSDQEFVLGLIGVGVPVRTPEGDVIAALALHAPAARLPIARAIGTVPILQRTADRIARAFAGASA